MNLKRSLHLHRKDQVGFVFRIYGASILELLQLEIPILYA
jgi:hypothetical protein